MMENEKSPRLILYEAITGFMDDECSCKSRLMSNIDIVEENMAHEGYSGLYVQELITELEKAQEKLNEQQLYEDNIRSKYNLSPDIGFEDLAKEIHRLRVKYERGGLKCNRGHVNHLPVSLWDCPICTEELRNQLVQAKTVLMYIATHNSYGNGSEGFAFCQNEAEAALSRLGVLK